MHTQKWSGVLRWLILIGLFITVAVRGQTDDPYRLPTNVKPKKYVIDLTLGDVFYNTKTFTGTVKISVDILEDLQIVTLNSADIIYNNQIFAIPIENEENLVELTPEIEEEYEQLYLTASTTLTSGSYTLVFENYTGTLHEDMYGFYLSSYEDEDGETEYIATTQFQATYARRAFPCFDEPSFKATFEISITRPDDYNSLGNTKLISSQENTDSFAETPIMSTYLVAFIVSKFKAYEGQHADDQNVIDVWCREEALPTANYSYQIGPKLLAALNTYTNISYYSINGVEKMDQVAIPDFSAGAMENWGLVTYRETALLWDPNESTRSYLQRVATVIAHEFAHMWFGNLVTLEWWSYTWLNEGFARYCQYFITAMVETEWDLEKQFVIEQQQVIFASDALESAAALNSNASTPSQISNKFASISYNKGASVIRMMANFLGEENFLNGIRQYLQNHSNSNTVPADLFDDLSYHTPSELPTTLANIMSSWTNLPGFPVVNVSRTDNGIYFKQERFLLDSSVTSDTQWYVPITYTTQEDINFDDTTIDAWLIPTEELFLEHENQTGWIVVNLQGSGYYRVNYDDELWNELESALKSEDFGSIPEINRAQLVDDILNLARANKVSYSKALNVTSFLKDDDSYYSWYAAFNAFSFLRRRIDSSSYVGQKLPVHILTLMDKLYKSVSFEINDSMSHIDILKTALTLQWSCQLENEDCVTEAVEKFETYVNDISINPNIRSTVYCSALRQSDTRDNWDFLWRKYTETKLATEQITILTALGCTQDEDILHEYLLLSINSTSGIRKQDANSVFSAVLAGNPANVDIAFKFLRDNVDAVVEYYEGMNALSSVITGIADRLTTEDQIVEFQEFITTNSEILKDAAITATTALESAKANINWVESNIEELNDWLFTTYGSAVTVSLNLTLFTIALATIFTKLF